MINFRLIQLLALSLIVTFSCYSNVSAQALSGSEDPRYKSAVEEWLSDSDTNSLKVLSDLAKTNNTAARLLLSRIEVTDRAPSEFLKSLSRQQWRSLFRAPAEPLSAFTPSWLTIENARGNALANQLLGATSLGINIDLVQTLIDSGESEAVEHLIRKIAVDGTDNQRDKLLTQLVSTHELYPYLLGFRNAAIGQTTGHSALNRIINSTPELLLDPVDPTKDTIAQNASVFVGIGYQAGNQLPEFNLPQKYRTAVSNWVDTAPAGRPLAAVCYRACSTSEFSACAFTVFGLLGGYYEIIRLDSPIENLISQKRFLNSERAIGMTTRRIINARTETGKFVFNNQELSLKSSCLAKMVAGNRKDSG